MPSDTAKALILLLALLHAKSLPGVYTLRSLSYFIKARNLTKPAIGLLEASKYQSRVWFDDLDLNIHLNNSSYNKMMDFARIQLCTLLFPGWQHRHKFDMCLAQTVLFFKAEVPRFSKYTITSRIFAWDDKWIWLQHRFSIKRKTRPVRKALEIAAAIEGQGSSSANADANVPIRDEDVVVEEEDEDDIDPIDAKAPKTSTINSQSQVNLGNHPNDAISDLPDKLCCIAYSRMVAKHPKGKTIVPVALFEKMGHREAYPGEWEQYRQLGMSLIEGMMKIGDPTADLPPAPRRLVNPTRARI
jgi:acyl-CoA thioesterase FadM